MKYEARAGLRPAWRCPLADRSKPLPSDVWRHQAVQWERVGPPLRPSAPDTRCLERIVQAWVAEQGVPSVLVLGVTPEMAKLSWPEGTDLLAVDRSAEMIQKVWPGYPGPGEGTLLADWMEMSLPADSRDLVIGDGCFNVLSHPEQHQTLMRVAHETLRPSGRLAFRAFVRPEAPEQPADVYRAVMNGEIGNFHAFKLRLLMAVQPSSEAGVVTGDVWKSWLADGPRPEDLASRLGWPLAQITTIEAYRDQDTVLCFPTLAELRGVAEERFEELGCEVPPYELGERCPTLVLAPRET
ncbi:MAG: class I SAM-dependent methyltransferase [Deltaproteobacteria bacterium]|nr:class I SAM-dependent methyltransferase [Deltaproteobacteria bacterium]